MIIAMLQGQAIFWALVGGILPAIVWLLFWLREDRKNPEPKALILLAFLSGMLVVPLMFPFEQAIWDTVCNYAAKVGKTILDCGLTTSKLGDVFAKMYQIVPLASIAIYIIWAFFEETFKYIACKISVLRRREMDEPIDAMIYLITVALGFSALENTFFIIQPLLNNDIVGGIVTGNLRFVGASLLHIVASATVGIFIAISFNRKTRCWPVTATLKGLVAAVVLHALFNLFIMKNSSIAVFTVFLFVWAAIIVLLGFFEKVKRI